MLEHNLIIGVASITLGFYPVPADHGQVVRRGAAGRTSNARLATARRWHCLRPTSQAARLSVTVLAVA
eukprot:75193-Pleurochrysis_carterae.AAC.1